jgi:hypothetical protein
MTCQLLLAFAAVGRQDFLIPRAGNQLLRSRAGAQAQCFERPREPATRHCAKEIDARYALRVDRKKRYDRTDFKSSLSRVLSNNGWGQVNCEHDCRHFPCHLIALERKCLL